MERGMSFDVWMKAFYRRRWILGILAAVMFVLMATGVMLSPAKYAASSVIRLEPPRIGDEMVQRTVADLVEQRLLVVRQELLARPVLQKAISELGLYPEQVSHQGMEAAVETMRKEITVKVEGDTAFEFIFEHENPNLASAVANRLPELYAEETIKVRRGQVQRATQLFQDELSDLSTKVIEHEKTIAQFKVEKMGELPEQLESNMRALERVSGLIASKGDQLRAADLRRSELVRSRYAADSEVGRMKTAEDAITRELLAAKVRWTSQHPEIVRLEKEQAALIERRKGLEVQLVTEQQERAHATATVNELKAQLIELERNAVSYQTRLDNTPRWAHDLGVLQRDYDILRAKYQSLISRKVEAELAEQLEVKSAPNLFRVVSPAAVPLHPAKPDRMGGLLLSLMSSIVFALLLGAILEFRDDSIKDAHQFAKSSALPVLAAVPQLPSGVTARIGRRHNP